MPAAPPNRPAVESTYGRPLIQVAREIGRHPATLGRWRSPGIEVAPGVRCRCMMTRIGGRWHIRDEDLAGFFAALAAGPGEGLAATPKPGQSAARAARELEEIGI